METALAAWLRAERARKRESQETVATAVGKSRSWLASLERAELRPRIEDCVLLATYFGASPKLVLEKAGYGPDEIRMVALDDDPALEFEQRRLTINRSDLIEAVTRAAIEAARQAMEDYLDSLGREDPATPELGELPPDPLPTPLSRPARALARRSGASEVGGRQGARSDLSSVPSRGFVSD